MADPVDLGQLLEDSGAILRGHFRLTSGRHSAVYFEKFRVLERPDVLSALSAEIARFAGDLGVESVAGPTTGGIIIAFEVARQMGLPAVYVESENGIKTLRRGKTLPVGQRVLIVDDVLTTGTSLDETAAAIRAAGGEPIAYAVLIDRSSRTDWTLPLFGAYRVQAESFAPDELPDWLAEIPIQQPGTRKPVPNSGTK
ncbi:MAG: orotate phosphoribosyltransferase [Fimbriimonadaceae bacterium]|nr:orotate phosphoribosyltransferase [Fimbriimonadaceae bacterium]